MLDGDDGVVGAVDEEQRSRGDRRDDLDGLDLVEPVAVAQVRRAIHQVHQRHRRQPQPARRRRDHPTHVGEGGIGDDTGDPLVPRSHEDGHGGTHREADDVDLRVGAPLGHQVDRRLEVALLVVRQGLRPVGGRPVAAEVEHQDREACPPQPRPDAEHVGLVAAMAVADDDDLLRARPVEPPPGESYAVLRRERHVLGVDPHLERREPVVERRPLGSADLSGGEQGADPQAGDRADTEGREAGRGAHALTLVAHGESSRGRWHMLC